MIYLTLDTCVWLMLLKADLYKEDGVFGEICYWIENGHLTHITTPNLIKEWDRHKTKKAIEIVGQVNEMNRKMLGQFLTNAAVKTLNHREVIETEVTKRLERIDYILKHLSETAPENDVIYIAASVRNLDCQPPNHVADSFRDTVNILSLTTYLMAKNYPQCFFSTINYKDFSAEGSKHDLHSQLTQLFTDANLTFVFFDDDPPGGRLVKGILGKMLPDFQIYLSVERNRREELVLAEQKLLNPQTIENPDIDFIENIKHIDVIISKKQPTAFELKMITDLIERHPSYKEYFLNKVGNNGMV